MMTSRTWLVLAPLSLLLIHCGGETAAEDPTDDGSDVGGSGDTSAGGTGGSAVGGESTGGNPGTTDDTTAPTVISVSPENGDVGVAADTPLVIEFSERMDKAAAQAGYQSADIPAGEVTFDWNAEGTVLTVHPTNGLAYATGPDPATVSASIYSFTISSAAEDQAGNSLALPVTVEFSTLRQIEQTLTRTSSLCGLVRSDTGQVGTSTWIGDTLGNGQYKGFTTMDIAPLPDDIVSFEAATLRIDQVSSTLGDPYGDLGGQIDVFHVMFNQLGLAALSSPPLSGVGVLSTDDIEEYKEISVLPQLIDDYEHRDERGNRSQYRLELPIVSDFDEQADVAIFHSQTSDLQVTYLIE
jgi:hypothetical protein